MKTWKMKKYFGKVSAVPEGVNALYEKVTLGLLALMVFMVPGVALADPVELTVPDVSTDVLYSVGTKVFAAIAIFVAIAMGIRFFKKA